MGKRTHEEEETSVVNEDLEIHDAKRSKKHGKAGKPGKKRKNKADEKTSRKKQKKVNKKDSQDNNSNSVQVLTDPISAVDEDGEMEDVSEKKSKKKKKTSKKKQQKNHSKKFPEPPTPQKLTTLIDNEFVENSATVTDNNSSITDVKKNHKAPRGSLTEPMMNDLEPMMNDLNENTPEEKISSFLEASAHKNEKSTVANPSLLLLEKLMPSIPSQLEEDNDEEEYESNLDVEESSSFATIEIIVTIGMYLLIEMVATVDLNLQFLSLSPEVIAYIPSSMQPLFTSGNIFVVSSFIIYLYCMNLVFVWAQRMIRNPIEKFMVHYRFFRCLTGIITVVFAATLYMSVRHEATVQNIYMERTVHIFYSYLMAEFCFYIFVRDPEIPRTVRPAIRSWVFGLVLCCVLYVAVEDTVRYIAFSMAVYSSFAQIAIFVLMTEQNIHELTQVEEIFDAVAILLAVYFGGDAPGVNWIRQML